MIVLSVFLTFCTNNPGKQVPLTVITEPASYQRQGLAGGNYARGKYIEIIPEIDIPRGVKRLLLKKLRYLWHPGTYGDLLRTLFLAFPACNTFIRSLRLGQID